MSRGSWNGIKQLAASYVYRDDTGKNDQGHAFLSEDSAPLRPDRNSPTTTAMVALAVSEDRATYNHPP
jgi:hypothetical protein